MVRDLEVAEAGHPLVAPIDQGLALLADAVRRHEIASHGRQPKLNIAAIFANKGGLPQADFNAFGPIKYLDEFAPKQPNATVPAPVAPKEPKPAQAELREYAYLDSGSTPVAATILWKPAVIAAEGRTVVEFKLPPGKEDYLIRIDCHTAAGQLGSTQIKINTSDQTR